MMNHKCKVYKRRPADDGGEYFLMPSDDNSTEIPIHPGETVGLAMPILDLPERALKVESSAEVEAMVDRFFASLNKAAI